MKIGDKQAFPPTHEHGGMTCREWLIGQLAKGRASLPGENGYGASKGEVAVRAIGDADAILARLDAEKP